MSDLQFLAVIVFLAACYCQAIRASVPEKAKDEWGIAGFILSLVAMGLTGTAVARAIAS